jgi:hypothetical protein
MHLLARTVPLDDMPRKQASTQANVQFKQASMQAIQRSACVRAQGDHDSYGFFSFHIVSLQTMRAATPRIDVYDHSQVGGFEHRGVFERVIKYGRALRALSSTVASSGEQQQPWSRGARGGAVGGGEG